MSSSTESTTSKAATAGTTEGAAGNAGIVLEEGPRSVRTIVRNSAYATLGVGDLAVGYVRTLNQRAAELRAEAPNTLRSGLDRRELAARIDRRVDQVRSDATKEFDRLSERGRSLLEGIQRSSATKRAFQQVGTARSQVKSAATSVTKATRFVGQAAEESVTKVGADATIDYSAKSLDELRELARQLDISGRSTMNRDELIRALEER